MHPTASIGPHEISGSRDWTGAVILLGTSCFNIQIVICHPTPCWDCFSCLPSQTRTLPTPNKANGLLDVVSYLKPVSEWLLHQVLQVLTSLNLF